MYFRQNGLRDGGKQHINYLTWLWKWKTEKGLEITKSHNVFRATYDRKLWRTIIGYVQCGHSTERDTWFISVKFERCWQNKITTSALDTNRICYGQSLMLIAQNRSYLGLLCIRRRNVSKRTKNYKMFVEKWCFSLTSAEGRSCDIYTFSFISPQSLFRVLNVSLHAQTNKREIFRIHNVCFPLLMGFRNEAMLD